MLKVLERSGIRGTYLNVVKVYCKPISNIKLIGKKLKIIPIKLGARQSCSLSSYILNIELEALSRVIRQLKEIKWIQIGKEEIKVLLFADGMTLYTSDH